MWALQVQWLKEPGLHVAVNVAANRSFFIREENMKNLLAILTLSAMAAALSACYTVKGVGEDVSATGHAVSNVATVTKPRVYHHHN